VDWIRFFREEWRPVNRCLVALLLSFASLAGPLAAAQDIPLVRQLLQQQLVAEMHEHNSEESAWFNEKSKNRESWTSGKVLGKKIRLASWTEQSKTWIWLENPGETLQVEITRLNVTQGRAEFAVRATAKARFKAWGRIPKLAQASVGGNILATFEIEGSTAVADGGLDGSKVTLFKGELKDLRFNNDLAHPLEDLVKDALNDYVNDKNEKMRRSVEKAIDRVRFSKPAAKTADNQPPLGNVH
jgi:hypothetical protein